MKRFAVVLILLAACGSKGVDRSLAEAACDHEIELGYWKGFDGSLVKDGLDPKDPAMHAKGLDALPGSRKSDAWKKAVADCTDGFSKAATAAQLECVKAATSVDGAQACLTK